MNIIFWQFSHSIYLFVSFEAAFGILRLSSTSPSSQPELFIFAWLVPINFKLLDYKQSCMNSVKGLAMQNNRW